MKLFVEAVGILDQWFRSNQIPLVEGAIRAAVRNAHIRAEWYSMDNVSRREQDASRTRAHDAFIDACNLLSREMRKAGEDNAWRAQIGTAREEIGDFACYIHCIVGLKSR